MALCKVTVELGKEVHDVHQGQGYMGRALPRAKD